MIENAEKATSFQWFVLRIRVGREKMVDRVLTRRGFATFKPDQKVYRYANGAARRRKLKHERTYPLLPGYLFIGLTTYTPTWANVFDLTPVLSVIGSAGVPQIVRPDALKRLMRRYGRGEFNAPEFHRKMETHREYSVGDMVVTGDGLIEGRVEEIVRTEFGAKARIFVEILGSERLIEADLDKLVAA